MRAKCLRCPSCQSSRAEWAVTRLSQTCDITSARSDGDRWRHAAERNPHHNHPLLPLDPRLQIRTHRNMIVQELEQVIALLLLETDNAASELRVDVQGLLARDGMRADDGVDVADRFAADDGAAGEGTGGLFVAGVHGFQAVEALAERGGEALVGHRHVGEEGVASGCRAIETVEERGARGLHLERDIGMPRHGVRPLLEEVRRRRVIGAAVDQMHSREPLGRSGRLVDVRGAIVLAEVERFLDRQVGEVLVAEDYDFLLSDEESELVFAGLVEAAELDAGDFCADVCGEIRDLGVDQEVPEGWVGI